MASKRCTCALSSADVPPVPAVLSPAAVALSHWVYHHLRREATPSDVAAHLVHRVSAATLEALYADLLAAPPAPAGSAEKRQARAARRTASRAYDFESGRFAACIQALPVELVLCVMT